MPVFSRIKNIDIIDIPVYDFCLLPAHQYAASAHLDLTDRVRWLVRMQCILLPDGRGGL